MWFQCSQHCNNMLLPWDEIYTQHRPQSKGFHIFPILQRFVCSLSLMTFHLLSFNPLVWLIYFWLIGVLKRNSKLLTGWQLCKVRNLLAFPELFHIVVWNYTDCTRWNQANLSTLNRKTYNYSTASKICYGQLQIIGRWKNTQFILISNTGNTENEYFISL